MRESRVSLAPQSTRVAGIDVARGLAALIMLQGHATDGWVQAPQQDTAYGISRLLGTLPLPAFLLLAGTSVSWRLHIALERDEARPALRKRLLRRGLGLVLAGYGLSALLALIDGVPSVAVLLLADVLHVIGLSIALASLLPMRSARAFVTSTLVLGAVMTAACPFIPVLHLRAPFDVVAGLFVDAPPVTRMPLVPLFAWFAAGALAAHLMWRMRGDDTFASVAGASQRFLLGMLASALVLSVAGWFAMAWLAERFPAPISRQHPAIWANVIDLAGRGLLVLALGALLAPRLPRRLRRALVVLGQGSMTAYIVHLPFCYGRLAAPMRGATMAQALMGIAMLTLVAYGAVWLRKRLR